MKQVINIYQKPNSRGEKVAAGFNKEIVINPGDTVALAQAVEFDNCPAKYKDWYRTGKNFQSANCVLVDLDNGHSDNPADWITTENVAAALVGVEHYFYPSRNHMKPKDGKDPRPKYHFIFPTNDITSAEEYAGLMKRLIKAFPDLHFDEGVSGAAQLNFGVEGAAVSYVDGKINLADFMRTVQVGKDDKADIISQGWRHSTLISYATRVLKRYGNENGEAYEAFTEEATKCSPPMDDSELTAIWDNAVSFYDETIKTAPDYVVPAAFVPRLAPDDYTDLGQARVLARVNGDKLRYSRATKWLFYTDTVWTESEMKAHGLTQFLTDQQLKDAHKAFMRAHEDLEAAEKSGDEANLAAAKKSMERAGEYYKFVLTRRNSGKISAALKEVQPMLEVDVAVLDADPLKLNTPTGTVDLRTGQLLLHDPLDFCTKMTASSPTDESSELFTEFLKVITCEDKDLEAYLQLIAGMFAVGTVFCEVLVIAYGGGRNGKSTFFNLLARIMGDYSGNLSAETLTVNCRKNKSPEYAELRGKRLVIAAELEEGMRLDTAIVKKLCSTDPIYAEKKYKDPFRFIPSHTVVLYTNHLPKVGTSDAGTWRRLVVIPFNAVIEGKSDIKNYADYLFKNAGGTALAWIIEGARKFVAAGCKIEPPECVKQAIANYRGDNDWVSNYIYERCETNETYTQPSGELYGDYRNYCKCTGDYARSAADFKAALEGVGYEWRRINTGAVFYGLRLKQEPFTEILPMPYVEPSRILPLRSKGYGGLR